jgi:hypothetical protein
MSKFQKSDDGKVVDGSVLVYLDPPAGDGSDGAGEGSEGAGEGSEASGAAGGQKLRGANARKAAVKEAQVAQAGALEAAAGQGVPFCQRCEPPAAGKK